MMLEENFVDGIITLHKENNWKDIINNYHDYNNCGKLLWVFPSEKNLQFISDNLRENDVESIISIGCGSGLLEWIIAKSLDLKVIGIEVDGAWWKCKYAPPSFIPQHIASMCLEEDIPTQTILKNNNASLLFCYFNNGAAFDEYIKHFTGDMVIIIGPGDGNYRLTNPMPFQTSLCDSWMISGSQEVRETKDFIAVYTRRKYSINGHL